MSLKPPDSVEVKRSIGRGRGVYARRPIKKGEIIERAPVILLPTNVLMGGEENPYFFRYFFCWEKNKFAMALGYGSLYNHSFQPNAVYEYGHATLIFRAIKPIAKGEEIFVNYNGDPKDQDELSFKVV